jgi:hypothetical protein
MDRLPSATSLSRALLSLSRARASGVLVVRSDRREGRVSIVEGSVGAVALWPADDETLGDALDRMGALDRRLHRRALERGPPPGPVGDWLVACGAARNDDVQRALRAQLHRRVVSMFAWPAIELRFAAGRSEVGVRRVERPLGVSELVLGAMRTAVADEPLLFARRTLGDGLLVLTRLGRALVEDAALSECERAMLPLLREGHAVDAVLAAAGASPEAIRALHALRVLGAVARPTRDAPYALLLRKHRQVRSAARAGELLELPTGAPPGDARRALRRLARAVHPDRFSGADDDAVRRVSGEVMAALVSAEARLRTG